jgi:uncharacterized protein YprB with RNaseH-like and TPR domain
MFYGTSKRHCFIKDSGGKITDGNSELTLVQETQGVNEAGSFALIQYRTANVTYKFPRVESLKKDLQLIYGIGPKTSAQLNQDGIFSVADLLRHPFWERAARDLLKTIENKDLDRLARYGASDFQLLSFFRPETVKFIDIETIGLYYIHPVFLVGVLYFEDGGGYVKQFLARNFDEEKAILKETARELYDTQLIASFNGRSFDLPYLKNRMKYHQLNEEMKAFHVDLLHPARKQYKGVYPNCRLITLEKELFNQERENDVPGAEIADYYYRYLDTQDRTWLDPILEHNALDLLSMAKLLGVLIGESAKRSMKSEV